MSCSNATEVQFPSPCVCCAIAQERLLGTHNRLGGLGEAGEDSATEEDEHALGGEAIELADEHGEGADGMRHGVHSRAHGHGHHDGVEVGEQAGGANGAGGAAKGGGRLDDTAKGEKEGW